ncbi:DsbA family protein [Halorubrum sp. DTA46]|uniref:DsbA family protein n=1 Tax=Halorubrum sp. DTA46 TaxID=3402162 RepID=UPI003AAEC82F
MEHTRRSLLAGAAVTGVAGVAGCLGGGSGGGGGTDLDTSAYDCELGEPADADQSYRPVIGDRDADVVVRAFEDFTCGHCATYKLDHFPTIREEYIDTGQVRYEHWDFPIPVDEAWAVPVASAARGVGEREGDDAFFAFASAVYESHGSYDGQSIGDAAEAAGADPCAALADAQFATYEDAAMSDREEGESMGVSGTPTIFVNGSPVEEGYAAESVMAAIDAEL